MDIRHEFRIGWQFAVLHEHPRSGRTADAHPRPPGDVPADIVSRTSVPFIEGFDRGDRSETTYRRHHLGIQRPAAVDHGRGPPAVRDESRPVPPGFLFAGVVQLPVPGIVVKNRTAGGRPTAVGHYISSRPVGVFDAEQRDRLRLSDPQGAAQSPDIVAQRVVLSASDHDPQRVVPAPDIGGHIVGYVKRPFMKIRPGRIEDVIADFFPVQKGFVIPHPGHVQRSCLHFLPEREFFAKQRRRIVMRRSHIVQFPNRPAGSDEPRPRRFAVTVLPILVSLPLLAPLRIVAVGNPTGAAPIPFGQQPHAPHRGLAPRPRLPRGIPHLHLPVTAHTGFQRLAGILDLNRPVGRHPAAVPKIPPILFQQFRRRGHQNAVSGLAVPALAGNDFPTQPRRRHVDPQRIIEVFATQPLRAGRPKADISGQQQSK